LDVQSLKQGLDKLPQQARAHAEQRAAEQISAMEAAYPRLMESPILDEWPDSEIDRLVGQFGTMPCPALADNGLCLVYAHRPLTCRSMGIPIEEGALTQGACQVQTFVPIVRLSAALRAEEQNLAGQEAALLLPARQRAADSQGEELLLPYGFHPRLLRTVGRQST
jgi:Fe-S-cluster containining protein